jgi:hypothetical protein
MLRSDFLTFLPSGLGNLITDTVRTFADKTGLQAEFWVQDLPLWSLSRLDSDTGIWRRLQVGAYWINQTPELRIVPEVFRIDRNRNALIARETINPELIRVVSVWDVGGREKLMLALEEAWSAAIKMAPPEPTAAVIVPLSSLHGQF